MLVNLGPPGSDHSVPEALQCCFEISCISLRLPDVQKQEHSHRDHAHLDCCGAAARLISPVEAFAAALMATPGRPLPCPAPALVLHRFARSHGPFRLIQNNVSAMMKTMAMSEQHHASLCPHKPASSMHGWSANTGHSHEPAARTAALVTVSSSLERAAKTRLWQRAESRQDSYVLAFALPKTAMDIAVQPQPPVIVSITFQSKFMAVPGCGRDPRPGEKCMSPALSALLSPNTVRALGGVGEPVEGLRICLELLLGTDLAKVSTAESEVADSGLEARLMGLWGSRTGCRIGGAGGLWAAGADCGVITAAAAAAAAAASADVDVAVAMAGRSWGWL